MGFKIIKFTIILDYFRENEKVLIDLSTFHVLFKKYCQLKNPALKAPPILPFIFLFLGIHLLHTNNTGGEPNGQRMADFPTIGMK